MNDELYAYLDSVNGHEQALLRELREETLRDPAAQMAVSPMEGQFLAAVVKMIAARKICEVGVYTGYSSLSMGLALPTDGHLWCFDIKASWTDVAQKYWRRAGVDTRVTLWIGDAMASMRRLIQEGHANTFDLVFIDADKSAYGDYWDMAHVLLRSGGLAIADNTLFQEAVPANWTDDRLATKWSVLPPVARAGWISATHSIRAFNQQVHNDSRFAIAIIPVGDGMTFGVKLQ